ncbi:MAG: methylated-DNA--[protein]-cysteine S-methyltransferase [Rhodospirillaceae bacterium]|jgi:methylated-DNA-[protein]-cysteine S-methyltransferase|nr:methylated-DNA--[protein]-cysteine S-methyltransferase [Rhodospirillaceae bacterium]MBT5458187.1 methylated-DNA--[protein]-cysteine S-methyltransferase [Rhodospirillaceae bacterium]
MPCVSLQSPLGPLTVHEEDGLLTSLDWCWSKEQEETGLLSLMRDQLSDYFDGTLTDFSLPLAPAGTPFQHRVWSAMCHIPYGEVRSYGDIARQLKSGARAVGMACGRNPLPIFIPCHRVVGADGTLTGYSGGDGLASKEYLLTHEGFEVV